MRPTARMPKLTRRSRILILIALGVIALLLAGPRLIDAYVDWLWFGELGYRSVFSTVLVTRFVVFLIAGLLVGGIVFAGLAVAYRTRPVFVPSNDNDPVARYRALVLSRLRLVSVGVPVAIGLLAGIIAQSYWVRIQLFLHGGDFGIKDPQFGKDLGFYAFELPFYRLLLSYLFVAVFLAFVANLLAHYIFGGIRLSGRTGALSRRRASNWSPWSACWCCSRRLPTGWTATSCCRTPAAASRSPAPGTPTSTRCCRPS